MGRLFGTDGVRGVANRELTAELALALGAAAAQRLATMPPHAVRASKMLLRSDERTVSGRMAEEMRAFVEALKGPEFAQVIAERRRPR